MARRRPKGVLELGWAVIESAATGRAEHAPTAEFYTDDVVRRVAFQAGGGHGWRISALSTPRSKAPPWKIVVITGAPSWAEYWAPALAALPQDREMIVVDRPGFAGSEPVEYVGDIRVQAQALMPLLETAPNQKLLLVGQSYGAAIATLMAGNRPARLQSLVLLSGFFGETGPTGRWLVELGSKLLKYVPRLVPRDLKNAVREVRDQHTQLDHMRVAMAKLKVPVHVVHGDADDFAPIEIAERLVRETRTRRPMSFRKVEGANHFFNDEPAEMVLGLIEDCLPKPVDWKGLGKAAWAVAKSPFKGLSKRARHSPPDQIGAPA